MTSISLRGVQKRFGDTVVLRDCDLEIDDHEFLVLVGPSGSGKTTLLRIIAGLETPTDGVLYFGDDRVDYVDVGDRDIAMVFQNYGLYPHMSVYKNMAFGLRRRKMPKAMIDQKVRETGELLGIGHLLERRPKQLSGGQRQRVALGRAIVRDPAVFLLDEPLSNLDAHLRVQMRAEILKVHRAVTATAIYVTHDQVEAMTMGDRIAVMNDGVIQQLGTPDELYDHPVNKFVAGFIGTPAMGFLTCDITRSAGGADLHGQGVRLRLPADRAASLPDDADKVVCGIRPEHFQPISIASADEHDCVMQGVVEVVEPLGSEQHLIVEIGGQTVVAKLPREHQFEREEKVALTVDPRRLHLFDCESGEAYL
ncbi:MAG: sn-glycerol-3-phosphate ABC transporter ATP-binding protein UgpC [Actinophytocola sp.]|uniref:ABC transporter ATP-binding protein n=1 Tax=Actinophytocola sp. TaxID=1872138 RepID=UPI0013266FFE|nr:ABC transporter ATP-binding protein [Actinophytocola sp.]MPZ82783.1 sn-glycerol-3-phosphate ABC transporter ATP-binding protein UgpC [Actinophytocola sp.]